MVHTYISTLATCIHTRRRAIRAHHIRRYTHTHMYIYAQYMYIYMHIYVYVYICIRTHTHTYIHIYAHPYAHTQMCTNADLHTYIHNYQIQTFNLQRNVSQRQNLLAIQNAVQKRFKTRGSKTPPFLLNVERSIYA
jgi:hypothetical protein